MVAGKQGASAHGKPFDRDLRIRIIAAVNGGMSYWAAARHFSASPFLRANAIGC
jgi:hypothetical protein